jgi:hypothetical protein
MTRRLAALLKPVEAEAPPAADDTVEDLLPILPEQG